MSSTRRSKTTSHMVHTSMLLCLTLVVAGESLALGAASSKLTADLLRALELRSIGPALSPGRIADIVVDPTNRSTWYVAVASGGLWKTTNRGTTWTPIFDEGGSYSLGCVALDPRDPNVVWLGTGENQSLRSVSFGDGIYKSTDAGETWEHKGLPNSEHIAKILFDPRDAQVMYVASQGPLWVPGGDRGLYKSTDGGQTWKPILEISENTGITDVVLDPRDPDLIYAASYQRRRHVGICIGGGPEAGIFKSSDAGATWTELTDGIPAVDLGRIALALSPQNPDIVYALVVAAGDESGFFRSVDRGATWERRSNYRVVDPQFYGEIYPDPHHFERVYAVDVTIHVTDDGGKTFERVRWQMHVDNHAMAFDPTDPDHLLVGNDGGLYETYDGGRTWRHFTNLPSTQYYRVAVDNAEPFYHVYGGSQDNGSHGGPSRTIHGVGIRTSDWISVGGGDGMQPRIDPTDPGIVYSMSQYGAISRLDTRTGESRSIRPRTGGGRGEADANEPAVRWNWDTPFIISPHSPSRLYFAGSRLFRSDDRGDNWEPISDDLTRQIDSDTIPVMGQLWDANAVTKNLFTTELGVSTALSESPLIEGLLYVGTDDGLVQISEDGGENWRQVERFDGVPEMAYVSDLFASQHDTDTVYVAFNHYKSGDFTPYLLQSADRGRHWTSVAGNLPDRHPVWCIVEDSVNEQLLFVGTEYGLFVTTDGGQHWAQLCGGVPTIAFRDLEIQTRETDLVCATFGRGFYVLDDYTPLRHLTSEALARPAALFPLRHAYLYHELGYARAAFGNYATPNPPFGATFTCHLHNDPTDRVVLTITDADGNQVRQLDGPTSAGLHRVTWDLRGEADNSPEARRAYEEEMEMSEEEEAEAAQAQASGGEPRRPRQARSRRRRSGPPVEPGRYTVTLGQLTDGNLTSLAEPQTFDVVPLPGL